ncbi:MAG: chorismate synthase [Oscillospiraceae bacterium]|nr:chorismate synthase [Oscillospiraceae bacterium]
MSSTWKNRISLSIFGQSHGAAIGMTLDGLPAGETIDLEQLQTFLDRRAPGRFPWTTPRNETDKPEFLSGLVNGKTCGAPITAIIRNENTRSDDYANLRNTPRPGHADYTAEVKYGGFQDAAGGGHFSGRLTAALCIAGGICLQILKRRGITIGAHIVTIGGVAFDNEEFGFTPDLMDPKHLETLAEMDIPLFNAELRNDLIEAIEQAKQDGDSLGGMVRCIAVGVPPGLGDPMFNGMENRISSLVFGIPAVKGIDFGTGFAFAAMRGSEAKDEFCMIGGTVKTSTNFNGGILGGITTGMPILFNTVIKPTPSIGQEQESINLQTGETTTIEIKGRHDPCIVPRAVPCIEATAAIAILDAIMDNSIAIHHIKEN